MRKTEGKTKEFVLGQQGKFVQETYELYWSDLCHYLMRSLRGRQEDANDIAHSAFEKLAAVRNPEKIANPRAYLYTTARNLLIDKVRRETVARNSLEASLASEEAAGIDFLSPEHIVLQREKLSALFEIVKAMPAKRRRAFVLNRVYGLSYRKIALELKISEAAVKKHVFRALKVCHEKMSSGAVRSKGDKGLLK